jgi:hypothetical protein
MDQEAEQQTLSIAKLTRIYIKIRTSIQHKEAEHEAELAALKAQRDEVASAMKDAMMAQQVTSMKTDSRHGHAHQENAVLRAGLGRDEEVHR